MQKTKRKRRGNDKGCLNKKKNASKQVLKQRLNHMDITSEDESGNLVKSRESSPSELTKQIESQLSESVVSLVSSIGETVVFECTGIFIENLCADTTSILTSANLVGSLHHGITDNLTIKVRLPNDRVVIGWLHHYDFKYDLAVVNIRRARGFQEAHLCSSHSMQFESNSKVVAVGRCFDSGMLKFTNGTVIRPTSDALSELVISTCKMNMALSGWPLIDFDGNFVGVNLRRGERTAFVPMKKIIEFLGYSETTRHIAADTNDKRDSNRHSAAGTNYKPGLKSVLNDSWDQDILVHQGLEVFSPWRIVFYDREDASDQIIRV